ncbi:M28 family peptidase [Hyphococcus flavus]|uniref:M28 family peptidase n=1 Tax=Hyphococcus flavus TaxID=1866326 RepID=A0AAE9ZJE2_9PROT|nr:M28 family peptidase [Hyphococcus flavus]WDI32166.1 M28 family peptidase [Hyphococcus flavus]
MKNCLLAGLAAVSVSTCLQAASAKDADANRLEADVRYLSDDLFEGREAGTRGYDLAAKFVASRYQALGLKPGGDDGSYFQAVPMRETKAAAPEGGVLRFSGPNAPDTFIRGEDYLVGANFTGTEVDIEAEVVFVGFSFVSEEHGRDDFANVDVDGKIVAFLYGAPKFLNSEERAHNRSIRAQRASENGAIGALGFWSPGLEQRYSFADAIENLPTSTSLEWVQDGGEVYSTAPNIRASASISLDGAEKLFANAPHTWAEIMEMAESEQGEVPSFPLNMTARIESRSVHKDVSSPNVVAILEGADPALRDEYVVMTAHLDHHGIDPTDEEGDDEINNGAIDNMTGVSAILEIARLFAENPPRRSVIFIALTAEEKGLVGSDYFAQNPTAPAEKIVANINLDMAIVTYPFTDIVAFGGERSTMYPVVEAAAGRAGLTLSPDPQPEQGFFTRSDQYSFVKTGVPALNIDLGFANGGEAAQQEFLENHYHEVSDEADLIDYEQLRRFAQVNYEIARGVADMDTRPLWKKGDFFGKTFNGPMEE